MALHPLLGLILEREGILTPSQLAHLLAEQARRRASGELIPLGMLVLAQGLASELQIRHALRLQRKLAWPPERPLPVGVRLVEVGLLAPSTLVAMMAEAERTGEPLEQVLVARQLVPPAIMQHIQRLAR